MLVALLVVCLPLAAIALALAFGGPVRPTAMSSINDPFKSVDFSDLPPVVTFQADDGKALAYRVYHPSAVTLGSITLIHGSSASSNSMHPMAKALAAAGYKVFALDIRGHGQSGTKGHIDYIGQLEADLAAFVRTVRPPAPATLAGFSAGGGFVLRVAGGARQSLFGSYLLLSPFISQDAANQRPGSGGWVHVGMPRVIALAILNSVGVRTFNGLWVTSFALNDQARTFLTPEYDFNLAMNFRPERDYAENIRNAARPCSVVAGTADEAFYTDRLDSLFRELGKSWPVQLLPGLGHIPLTLDASAHEAIIQHVRRLQNATY
jgi:alpha-beta hydrolase superfamily lysophospholipase